jgi:hypothetical protein
MLLRDCPEPATSEERRVRQQLKALLEAAAAQQAEGSATRQRSERGRAGATSTHGPNPPPSQHRECGEGVGAAALRSKVVLVPTATLGTPSRHDDELRASTTATTARAITTTVGADDATIATTTASAAGHQTSEVSGPLAGASATRNSLHASGLRPMCQDTMGTPTPTCGSRTTATDDLFVINSLPHYLDDSARTWL